MEALETFEDDGDNVVVPSFAALATLEAVAQMVDTKTLDVISM
jgi:hypothetical protein